MPTPEPLLEMRVLLKQLPGCTTFEPSHDVYVIATDNPFDYPDFERLAGLSHQLSHPQRHLSLQYLVAVLGDPHKVIFDLINRVAAVSVVHPSIIELKLTGSKPVV